MSISVPIEVQKEVENAGAATDELSGSGFKQTEESEQEISGIVHRARVDNIQQEQGEEDIQTAPSPETLPATKESTSTSEDSVGVAEPSENESQNQDEGTLTQSAEQVEATPTAIRRSFPLLLRK